MNVPVTYLELLEKKEIPGKQQPVYIQLENQHETDQLPQEENLDETQREVTKTQNTEQIIQDKRKQNTINRSFILDRLREKDVFTVKPRIYSETTVQKNNIQIDETKLIIPTPSEPEPLDTMNELKEMEVDDVTEIAIDSDVEENQNQNTNQVVQSPSELEKPLLLETEIVEQEVERLIENATNIGKKKTGRKPRKTGKEGTDQDNDIANIDLTEAILNKRNVLTRLPAKIEKDIIVASPYYMNNRKLFVSKLTKMYEKRLKEMKDNTEDVSCDTKSNADSFKLLTHQKIVRDYLNLYTPYRGLLIYHGLGSGKTCTSIAIAEGMKTDKQIIVMTPASLKMNFFSELKKCGDDMYKKDQYWEFIQLQGNPDYDRILSTALSLPMSYIRDRGGAWMLNVDKETNFTELSTEHQNEIDEQLNQMIRSKYQDINYNGLNMKKVDEMTENKTKNPFDNKVIIIDEAHNFVSRIVNKIKSPNSISYVLYDYLMKAQNAKIILLSGTPIINYPNEIGILYNLLRGYIKTWTMDIQVNAKTKIDTSSILKMLDDNNLRTYDYIHYSGNVLTITRNPLGFINQKKRGAVKGTQRARNPVNKTKKNMSGGGIVAVSDRYNGVKLDDSGNISDDVFFEKVVDILERKNPLKISNVVVKVNKCLPDDKDQFLGKFVDADKEEVTNIHLFKRRILGLTSYFRSAQEGLLPSFVETDKGDTYHVVKVEQSPHQYGIYSKIRKDEADREKTAKKQRKKQKPEDELFSVSSSYRIFSRAACNFVFPDEIDRPVPARKIEDINENLLDIVPDEVANQVDVFSNIDDDKEDSISNVEIDNYIKRIENALQKINAVDEETARSKYLTDDALQMLSPKFMKILENISDSDNVGLHLLYSHFRTIEGIGLMKLILLANGFAEFKIKKVGEDWDIVEEETDIGKPKFVLYTGTETTEEKEIVRNVYNGAWDFVPVTIANKLKDRYENNMYGDAIKVFMITSSGAEGINLKNTRFVHIVEPYWHMVRVDQVVGRARRICSHQELPEELRTVKVFLYISTFSEDQKTDDKNIELRIRDVSRVDKSTPITTDENLYEIASIKQRINYEFLHALKETAVDCTLYSNKIINNERPVVCYGVGKFESNVFDSYPTFELDQQQQEGLDVTVAEMNVREIPGTKYAVNMETLEVYEKEDYDNVINIPGTLPTVVGNIVIENGRKRIAFNK